MTRTKTCWIRSALSACCVIGYFTMAIVAAPERAFAQAKKPNKSNSNKSSGNGVASAQQHYANASTQLGLAKVRLQQAIKNVGHVRTDVQKEHESSPGLVASRRLLDEHRQEAERLKQEVRERLQSRPSYQDAIAARDEAKGRLTAISDSKSAEGVAAEERFKEANALVRKLETEAFSADPKTKAALDVVTRDETDLGELLRNKNAAAHDDSRISTAKNEIQQAKVAVAMAEQAMQAAAVQLAAAEQSNRAKQAAQHAKNQRRHPNRR